MPTVQEVKDQAIKIRDILVSLEGDFRKLNQKEVVSSREMTDKINSYNTMFEEEEARLQALGGKTRKQTLQEFVLLFFFISYAVFTVSISLYTYRTQGGSATQKMVGTLLLLALIISGILIRYG